jgi:hypothetical protein
MEQISYGLALWLVELPELIGRDQPPAVRRRLYPPPGDDEQMREEWERLMVPELFALLASSRDIVRKDLGPLAKRLVEAEESFEDGELVVPPEHVNGWISALNAARLALGAIYEVNADDMSEDRHPVVFDAREAAIARIDVFAWFQGTLIHGTHPPPPADEEPPDEDPTASA